MKGGRRLGKTVRLVAGLCAVLSLLAASGCAPAVIKGYESAAPAIRERREGIIQYAVTLLGKPYRSAAKGPDSFDCSGFVSYVFGRFDVMVPPSTRALDSVGYEVSRNDVLMGDLVVFRNHVGIMINAFEFIHASASRGVAIDSIDATYWRRSFSHFRRVL
jgi:cell wall-associated NlpC family hydrolase